MNRKVPSDTPTVPAPTGYSLISDGFVQRGDVVWNAVDHEWMPVAHHLVDDPVSDFFAVYRQAA